VSQKKRHPFYICHNFVKCHPILLIHGRYIPEEMRNKTTYTRPTTPRSNTNYSVPRTRTKFADRTFSVASPVVWNSLPAAVREAVSLYSFKRKLKTHFYPLFY